MRLGAKAFQHTSDTYYNCHPFFDPCNSGVSISEFQPQCLPCGDTSEGSDGFCQHAAQTGFKQVLRSFAILFSGQLSRMKPFHLASCLAQNIKEFCLKVQVAHLKSSDQVCLAQVDFDINAPPEGMEEDLRLSSRAPAVDDSKDLYIYKII